MNNSLASQLGVRPEASIGHAVLVLAVGLVVLTTNCLVPTLVGVYVDTFGLSVREAGLTAAVYMAGGGLGAAAVSWLLLHKSTVGLLAAALVALIVGNVASVYVHSFAAILAVRIVAGLGEGAGYALMGAGVSRMRNPHRMYGIFDVLMLSLAAAIQYSIPWLRGSFGPHVLFVLIAIVPALVLPFIRGFPDLSRPPLGSVRTERASGGSWRPEAFFVAGVAATLVAYIAYGAGFTYIERIGVHAGVPPDTVAQMLGAGYFIGVGGAALAIALSNVRARGGLVFVALLVVILSTVLTVTMLPLAYRIGVLVLFFAWFFFAPNLMGLMSQADPSGRLAAFTAGAQEWGIALGPAIAGIWADGGGFTAVAWIGLCGYGLTMLLLLPVLRHIAKGDLPVRGQN